MEKHVIAQILKSEPQSFSVWEIEAMLDEELSRDPSEMDTDFVDLCVEAYEKCRESAETSEKPVMYKPLKFKKVMWIAAVVLAFVMIVLPVTGMNEHDREFGEVVHSYPNYFAVNLLNGSTSAEKYEYNGSDAEKILKWRGIENSVLPSCMDSFKFMGDKIHIDDFDLTEIFSFTVRDINSDMFARVIVYNGTKEKELFCNGKTNVTDVFSQYEVVSVNGLDIAVFGSENFSEIIYLDNFIEYSISLSNCDFETALNFAKSIK